MDLGLGGKKVAITGATRGIGKAMAEVFAKEGASIALCARNEQHLAETVKMFEIMGVKVFGAALDIADHEAVSRWVNKAADRLEGLDVLVANPSAFGIGASKQDWDAGYAVDLMGTVTAIDAAIPYLEVAAAQTGDAAILVLSSALIAEADNESAYGAFKAALVHYSKGVSRRLASKGVRVNAISPGTIYVDDGFWGNVKRNMPTVYEQFYNKNPLGRMGCPSEVARAAAFLCSPAASFITGVNLFVDGAFTSRVNY